MNSGQCNSCGAHEGLTYFDNHSLTINIKGMERRVDDLAGWECQACGEVIFDPNTDSAERYCEAGDELVLAGRKMMGEEMKRIRRKLHLTQKEAVKLLSGGGHNAFSRYERGELHPPKTLVTLMRLLDRYPHLLADVQSLGENADFSGSKTTEHKEHKTETVS